MAGKRLLHPRVSFCLPFVKVNKQILFKRKLNWKEFTFLIRGLAFPLCFIRFLNALPSWPSMISICSKLWKERGIRPFCQYDVFCFLVLDPISSPDLLILPVFSLDMCSCLPHLVYVHMIYFKLATWRLEVLCIATHHSWEPNISNLGWNRGEWNQGWGLVGLWEWGWWVYMGIWWDQGV